MISEHLLRETHLCESMGIGANGPLWHCRNHPGTFDRVKRRRPHAPEELVDRQITVAFEEFEGGPDVIRGLVLVGRPQREPPMPPRPPTPPPAVAAYATSRSWVERIAATISRRWGLEILLGAG